MDLRIKNRAKQILAILVKRWNGVSKTYNRIYMAHDYDSQLSLNLFKKHSHEHEKHSSEN